MTSVTCRCDTVIEVDVPELANLDSDRNILSALLDGSFLSSICPRCGVAVRPEIALRITWPSKGLDAQVLPELERLSVYRDKAAIPSGCEALVGYPELFERVRMLRDDLDPKAVEILKYYLSEKALEAELDSEAAILYNGLESDKLVFHVLGLKAEQTGVVRLPVESYRKALTGFKETSSKKPFIQVFKGPYKSVKKLGFLADDTEDDR
ncbi:MAG: hypothetical protein E4H20_08135 [Spirochaetales bacterium]|nr:MAG: hypothetical protein E4H20_08135 [Spirochaetales bacterium]